MKFRLLESDDTDLYEIIENNFVTSTNPIGRSWLAPNGKFISNISFENDDYEGEPNHSTLLDWLYKNGCIKEDSYSELENLGYIRLSNWDSAIILTKTPPTNAQYNSLYEWIDFENLNEDLYKVLIDTPTDYQWYVLYEDNVDIKYIINRIKRYYASGNLYENTNNTSIENKLINKLKSQGYKYEYKPVGWYDDKDNPIEIEDHVDEYGNFEVPDNYFYRENNSHIFLGDNVDIIWDIDEQEKEFKILSIWSYKGAKKGEASQMLYSCLEEIPKDWTIIIKNNLNRSYWTHISSKFPKYKWTNESLEK